MKLSLPTNRIPTASEVVEWANSIVGQRIDVPGSVYGAQCWDLPNYLFYRIWGFKTPGNARDIAYYSGYPRGFKIKKNTEDFIPQPGDIAVWTTGSDAWSRWGHTDIVIGPSSTEYFWGVDQNWFNVNINYGSPAAKVKHTYFGVTHFIRPPYQPEQSHNDKKNKSSDIHTTDEVEIKTKKINKVQFTSSLFVNKKAETFTHFIANGEIRKSKPSKIVIKNNDSVLSTLQVYKYRGMLNDESIPHFYIDRNHIWACRPLDNEVPGYKNEIVLEINETRNTEGSLFLMNEITAMIKVKELCGLYGLSFNQSTLRMDDKAWKTFQYHAVKKIKDISELTLRDKENAVRELFEIYNMKDELLYPKTKDKLIPVTIKITENKKSESNNASEQTNQIENIVSKYSLNQALNIQYSLNPPPQTSNGYSWYTASRDLTSKAMNTNLIFNDSVQKYQLLKLNQYQGIAVDKLNQILSGKGTLSGKGQAFADGCKLYSVNEIYLIAHAFLESNYGRSNYASGRYGIYNYFGIGAYDYNPDHAITFARNNGWTTPESAIKGGAKFVGKSYFDVGQNTLYRMRWNPQRPGFHQYATDISWAKVQARIISDLYNKIGLTGKYYIYDKYK